MINDGPFNHQSNNKLYVFSDDMTIECAGQVNGQLLQHIAFYSMALFRETAHIKSLTVAIYFLWKIHCEPLCEVNKKAKSDLLPDYLFPMTRCLCVGIIYFMWFILKNWYFYMIVDQDAYYHFQTSISLPRCDILLHVILFNFFFSIRWYHYTKWASLIINADIACWYTIWIYGC